ncbi:Site-specific recombinase XerD [Filomicrobium insigne]|jgi:integrase/recombinase XerD|uniref:Site-specific recombinase XerD n=1 Tax=Filomicrobium insigne TaxID=418854 RepID=A0A1H0JN05_9HYPH|nr:site-specific integrase [Filomicrobium insigne]SDO44883.1 Site-specific recombinase XerD [Filomicrobium insigne]
MSNTDRDLIAELANVLTAQSYSQVVVRNYCAYARDFLAYLAQHEIPITTVKPPQVAQYLRYATIAFRKRRGRSPAPHWHSIPRSGIHALLRLAKGQWPPEPEVVGPEAALRHEICFKYETWLREERGLAAASIVALLAEARYFLVWQLDRGGAQSLNVLSVRDIDLYMGARSPGQRRVSLKDYAERLRSLLRYMYRTRYVASDLAAHVVSPMLYAYEGVPSILEPDQIATVLETTRRDKSPMGLRDYAILMLLATYGLRSGEVRNLTIEDIDWRSESLRVRHSKTGACSFLPLLPQVGEAMLVYLRHGRPRTDRREVFMRNRAPYRPLRNLASEVRRRLSAAGVKPPGKSGPHIFRHARAVEMLRASVPQKVIGDLLGHRSTEATVPYLKLATEDLRAIALDVPGSEVLA